MEMNILLIHDFYMRAYFRRLRSHLIYMCIFLSWRVLGRTMELGTYPEFHWLSSPLLSVGVFTLIRRASDRASSLIVAQLVRMQWRDLTTQTPHHTKAPTQYTIYRAHCIYSV